MAVVDLFSFGFQCTSCLTANFATVKPRFKEVSRSERLGENATYKRGLLCWGSVLKHFIVSNFSQAKK